MLRLLAVCGLLTIALSFDFGGNDEAAYESQLRKQGFSEEDVDMFLQEHRDASAVAGTELLDFVPWHEARGYYECEELIRRCRDRGGECSGCLKPKPRADICAQYDCPTMIPIQKADTSAPCGFEARNVVGGKWAVTPIDTSGMKKRGKTEAFWRLFKYINKANNQGVRMAKAGYVISRWFLNDNFQIESGQMAFYIPSAFQASPPTPTDDQVTVETWDNTITYNRVYGGDPTDSNRAIKKRFKTLEMVLAKESITPYPKILMTYEYNYLTSGCGDQRNEVIMIDNGSM